ncbi:MAG: hydrogenase maturation protease [Anaerolineae bacterium]
MARPAALVVGLGNLSRRDDGLGWFAVNAIRERLGQMPLADWDDGLDDTGHQVDCIVLPQLTPELAEVAAGYERLIVVDARVSGEDGVTVNEASALIQGARLLSHELMLADLLSLCEALYDRRPEAYLVSARGSDYDFGTGLSPAMEERLPEVVAAVMELVK